jgi:hypothetical protein
MKAAQSLRRQGQVVPGSLGFRKLDLIDAQSGRGECAPAGGATEVSTVSHWKGKEDAARLGIRYGQESSRALFSFSYNLLND